MKFKLWVATGVTVNQEFSPYGGDNWNSKLRLQIAAEIFSRLKYRGQLVQIPFFYGDYAKHKGDYATQAATLLHDDNPVVVDSNAPNGFYKRKNPTKALRTKKQFEELKRAGKIVLSDYEVISCRWEYNPKYREVAPLVATRQSNDRMSNSIGYYANYGQLGHATARHVREVRYRVNFKLVEAEWVDPLIYPVYLPEWPIGPREINGEMVTDVLADAESGVLDALTSLAELPETVKWLVDLAKDMAEACKATKRREIEIRKLAKRKGQTAVQIAEALASLWLQFRYAIMPNKYLIEDIIATLENLKRVFAEYKERLMIDYEMPKIGPGSGWTFVGKAEVTERCFIKRSYSAEDVIEQLLNVLKVNPLTTAVELISLSFTWEWLVNLGSFLTALTGSKPHTEQGAQFSWRYSYSGVYVDTNGDAVLSITGEEYTRRVINPSAHIGLHFRLDMNWMRYLDAISIASGPFLQSMKSKK